MPFTPKNWQDGPAGGTPITEAELDRMETGIDDAHAGLIDNLAITTAKIADLAVTAAKIANDTITASQIAANAIGASELADNAVDTAAIVDAAVTAAKLATVTKKVALPLYEQDWTVVLGWADAVTTNAYFLFPVPVDYVSGDITARVAVRGAAGTVAWRLTTFRIRDNTAVNVIAAGVNDNFTLADGNSHYRNSVIAAAQFGAGDVLRWDFQRIGADGADTMATTLSLDGAWVEYTGRS